MKDTFTDITIVLDRSGSMSSVADDTIGGFNRFLDDQKKAPGSANITLHQFDTVHETPIPTTDIQKAPHLTTETFVPRGGTALLDAIGRAINRTGTRLGTESDSERAGKVIFVIITDGEENSSREFDLTRINEMIKHQRDKYSWDFVFLGANQDAIGTAAGMGINTANAITYAHNSVGTQSAFAAVASNVVRARVSGQSARLAFSDDQREEQKNAGAKTK